MTDDKKIHVVVNGKPLETPGKKPLCVPTQALADAIAKEFSSSVIHHPSSITKLAYTAIDKLDGNEEGVIEALLVYVDTETLSFRGTAEKTLAQRQLEQWNPILAWVQESFGTTWQLTSGLMPIDQPPELHKAVGDYLRSLSAMELAGACILASGYSSLALTLAVLKNHIDAKAAFALSRLEEETQAERWGRDEEADSRAQRLQAEILAAKRFLDLLNAP